MTTENLRESQLAIENAVLKHLPEAHMFWSFCGPREMTLCVTNILHDNNSCEIFSVTDLIYDTWASSITMKQRKSELEIQLTVDLGK